MAVVFDTNLTDVFVTTDEVEMNMYMGSGYHVHRVNNSVEAELFINELFA